ncbi:hypothetical protein HNR05_003232 [Leifsonia psychrotolerans]|uniref:Uncharacterized protein n=1 Tax=Glaciibacter psychrotolerans TaxID=670054 RepID=A0A7Z0J7L8_9MICO|nr:hypothetical protein [Leifsonia psychrotolerans]NYJ21441.1 hypothetical protein [Leifsonia psychrotolerans]
MIGRTVFMVGALGMLTLVLLYGVAFVVGGGRIGWAGTLEWSDGVPWPMMAIRAWVIIPLCWIAAAGSLLLVPAARWPQALDFMFLIAVTLVLFGMMTLIFAKVYPESGGTFFDSIQHATGIHWTSIALAPQAISLVALGIRLSILLPQYNAAIREQNENLRRMRENLRKPF